MSSVKKRLISDEAVISYRLFVEGFAQYRPLDIGAKIISRGRFHENNFASNGGVELEVNPDDTVENVKAEFQK